MDRRFLLTNFLARRIAKVGRPPRPSDDLKGLARLAAELYTGSTSSQALRAAHHGAIPAARLNAIRAVLEASRRRPSSVADFLDAAGLALSGAGATLRGAGATLRRPEVRTRSWSLWPMSIWRLAVPMAAVVAIASLVATYRSNVAASAEELKVRGLDALRAVAARVTPTDRGEADPSESRVTLTQTAAPVAEAPPPAADVPRVEPPGSDPSPEATPHGATAHGATPHESPREATAHAATQPEAQPPRSRPTTAAARPTSKAQSPAP